MAKGYFQSEGIDYHETFSPVAKPPTIREYLSLALHFSWPIKQLDISNAFLHGILEEEVFMTQPLGFEDSVYPSHVCLLHKALYGLKQAPRAWYSTFSSFLVSYGFTNNKYDSSLFIFHRGSAIILLLGYADDILITGNDIPLVASLIKHMHSAFSMKELGNLSYFLRIVVHHTATGLFLS